MVSGAALDIAIDCNLSEVSTDCHCTGSENNCDILRRKLDRQSLICDNIHEVGERLQPKTCKEETEMSKQTIAAKLAQDIVAQATPKVEAPKKAVKVWRLDKTPAGKQLFTYMLAVLMAEGGFTAGRKVIDKKRVTARFDTATCIDYHKGLGRYESTKTGFLRLSVKGWNYFGDRLNGKNPAQQVLKADVDILAKAIKAGKMTEKTSVFGLDTKFIQVTVK